MADESTNYQCPSCKAPLRFSARTGNVECEYCGSSFSPEEIARYYAAAQAKADAKAAAEAQKRESARARAAVQVDAAPCIEQDARSSTAAGESASGLSDQGARMRTYSCSSCGAELVCDMTTAISECPYCGNPAVVPGVLVGEFKPDVVVPFEMDKQAAIAALDAHYKGKRLLPREFKQHNHLEKIQGVYVPFWLYDARVEGSAVFDAERSRTYRQGEYQVTETDHYEALRSGSMEFSRVPVDASTKMPDAHMDAIEPFDYGDLRPFSLAYLPGFAADRFDLGEGECASRAAARMRRSMSDALASTVSGYSSVSERSCTTSEHWGDPLYALLPVWMLHTTWKDKSFLFAMNGQTGRFVGDLPVSVPKAIGWFFLAFVLAAACVMVFMGLTGLFSDEPEMGLLVTLGVSALVAGGVVAVLYSAMKSAHAKREADAYAQWDTFDLSLEEDTYLTTTRMQTRIESSKD